MGSLSLAAAEFGDFGACRWQADLHVGHELGGLAQHAFAVEEESAAGEFVAGYVGRHVALGTIARSWKTVAMPRLCALAGSVTLTGSPAGRPIPRPG